MSFIYLTPCTPLGANHKSTWVSYALDTVQRLIYLKNIFSISKDFYTGRFCVQGRPPGPRAAHASAMLGCRGYICGGIVKVRALHAFQLFSHVCKQSLVDTWKWKSAETWIKVCHLQLLLLLLNAGNQDEWHPLPGPWIMDVVTNVCMWLWLSQL